MQNLIISNVLANEIDCGSPTSCQPRDSVCSRDDVDNVSSPETLCPSSPGSDINMDDDEDDEPTYAEEDPLKSSSSSLVFPVSLKDLNLREIKAVKIIRNGSTIVSNAASAVLSGIKSTSGNVPDAIKKLLGPVSVNGSNSMTNCRSTSSTHHQNSYPPISLSGNFIYYVKLIQFGHRKTDFREFLTFKAKY